MPLNRLLNNVSVQQDVNKLIKKPKLSFSQQYHQDTVDQGKGLINPDGSITTVMSGGVVIGDKVFNVPLYDRDSKRILSEDEAIKKWLPQIQSGEIQGFPLEWKGDIKDHPANVAARKEHKMLDRFARSLRNK